MRHVEGRNSLGWISFVLVVLILYAAVIFFIMIVPPIFHNIQWGDATCTLLSTQKESKMIEATELSRIAYNVSYIKHEENHRYEEPKEERGIAYDYRDKLFRPNDQVTIHYQVGEEFDCYYHHNDAEEVILFRQWDNIGSGFLQMVLLTLIILYFVNMWMTRSHKNEVAQARRHNTAPIRSSNQSNNRPPATNPQAQVESSATKISWDNKTTNLPWDEGAMPTSNSSAAWTSDLNVSQPSFLSSYSGAQPWNQQTQSGAISTDLGSAWSQPTTSSTDTSNLLWNQTYPSGFDDPTAGSNNETGYPSTSSKLAW
jgi:hypothetical protein